MKKYLIIACALCMAACHNAPQAPDRDTLVGDISSLEAKTDQQTFRVDTAVASQLLDLYTSFADAFPEDSLAPLYLESAARLSFNLDDLDGMVAAYDRIIDNYPDFERLDECYYEKAINLDNAGRKEEARQAYNEFLEVYPDHFLANDFRTALQLLDLSDELLIQHLTQNNK